MSTIQQPWGQSVVVPKSRKSLVVKLVGAFLATIVIVFVVQLLTRPKDADKSRYLRDIKAGNEVFDGSWGRVP